MLTRGLLGSLLVLGGGLVAAILPPSTPLLRHEGFAHLREWPPARLAALVAILLGICLLTHAWVALCRHAAAARAAETDDALALVRFTTVMWVAPLVLAPPLFSRDAWSYAAQGAVAAAGFSPYEHGPLILHGPVVEAVDPMWMATPAPYGPLPLALGEAMAHQTGNPLMLAIGHRLVALVGLALLAWAVPRLAGWCGSNPALAAGLVVASPLMLTNGVAGLHNDLLMVGLMAAALVLAVERGWVSGAVLGGLAAAVKLPGGLVCLAVVLVTLAPGVRWPERVRRLAQVALVSVGTLLCLGVVTGLGHGWVHALSVPGTVETPLSVTTQLSRLLGDVPAVRGAGTVLALGVAAWAALRWNTGERHTAVRAVAVVTGLLVLLSPVVHLWYLLWPLPFLAALPLRRSLAWLLVGGSIVAALFSPLEPSLRGDARAIWVSTLVALAGGALLLLGPGTRRLVDRLAPLTRTPERVPWRARAGAGSGAGDRRALESRHAGVQVEELLDRPGPREGLGALTRFAATRRDWP